MQTNKYFEKYRKLSFNNRENRDLPAGKKKSISVSDTFCSVMTRVKDGFEEHLPSTAK